MGEAAGDGAEAFDAVDPKLRPAGVQSSGVRLGRRRSMRPRCRLLGRDLPTVVLHFGDYDPSGVSLFEAVREDVTALYEDLGGEDSPDFLRAASRRSRSIGSGS